MVGADIRESKTRTGLPFLDPMAPLLVLLLPWSVLAALENGEISEKATNSGDIMNAIINQVVISMQREMETTNDSQNKEELPQQEGRQHHPSTVILDNWIRVIKKEMEKIGLMQNPGFDNGQERGSELATRIIKKSERGKDSDEEEDKDMRRLRRSFWMWERSLNRKAQTKPAWFVLPGAAAGKDATADEKGKESVLERKERDAASSENEKNKDVQEGSGRDGEVRQGRSMEQQQYNPMKSFWKWERTLNSRPKLANTAWFVLDNNEETTEDNKRKSNKRGGVAKSFQRWGNPLQHQSLTI